MKTNYSNDDLRNREVAMEVAKGLKQDVDEPIENADIQTTLARKAYQAYGKTTDFKNFQGNPMPEFDDLPDNIQNAWKASVRSVIHEVEQLSQTEAKGS